MPAKQRNQRDQKRIRDKGKRQVEVKKGMNDVKKVLEGEQTTGVLHGNYTATALKGTT